MTSPASICGTRRVGTIEGGKISGDEFNAVAVTEMNGQRIEIVINGEVSDDSIGGSLALPMMADSLSFTGTRN